MASSVEYFGSMARSSVIGGELARLVDADAERVLLGDADLDPAAALGDDAAGVQLAVACLDLDDEVDARASGGAG